MEYISTQKAIEISGFTISQLRYYAKRKKIVKVNETYLKESLLTLINSYKIINLENEIWVNIPFFDKRYFASNLGRIKTNRYKAGKTERLIKPALRNDYLMSVFLNDKNEFKSTLIHRLICLAFYPIENYKDFEVNHKNAIKTDNRIENLEWCTRQENIAHCVLNKLQTAFKGEEIGNSKLKEFQVNEIRSKFKPRIYTRKKLALEYNITEATIKDIILRRTWKHI